LQEKRQESDEEHQEDTDDATPDPVEHGYQVIATSLSPITRIVCIELANKE
jgi:hypothetical protein